MRKIFLRRINLKLRPKGKKLKQEFAKMRQEFDEHLQAINENTNEIAANYEYISEIERKLDKMSERIEQLQMFLESVGMPALKRNNFDIKRLNRMEQEVFLVIYTLEEEKGGVTYSSIADRLNISEHLASNYVTSLIEKGVPIIKRYLNSKPHLRLDPEFKTLQAKENILQLSLAEFGF
ncbi:HTH domain-containing protein [Candidatus Woesearchaeota archaeon]|nr:HTH domain-containing protein [Candidatus Woesearchaeota archaeon]